MTRKKTNKKPALADPNGSYFKIPLSTLDAIFHVKKLTPGEALITYNKLVDIVNKISSQASMAVLSTYATILTYEMLVEVDILTQIEKKEKESFPAILKEIYESITDLYIPFRIEYICADINNTNKGSKSPISTLDLLKETLTDNIKADPVDDYSWFDAEVLKNISSGLASISNQTSTEKKTDTLKVPSTIAELNQMSSSLKKLLIGQDSAIDSLMARVKLISVGFHKRGSFFFIGKTGVVKTFLAKLFGSHFYGNFEKINCAEFSNGHEVAKLIGAPPGYMGSNQKSFFQEKAEKSNRWIFLFDEIEKGHEKLFNLLLSLLDDGTITDSVGVKLDFSRSIFLFTSNQGIADLKSESLAFGNQMSETGNQEQLKVSLDRLLTPEFRNRIDEFIYFNDLTKSDAKRIAEIQLQTLPIVISDSILEFVVDNSYSPEYGVRSLKRFIMESIAIPLADAILTRAIPLSKKAAFICEISNSKLVVVGLQGEEVFIP